MSDLSGTIWLVAFGFSLLAAIPYLLLVLNDIKNRCWPQLIALLALPIIAFAAITIITNSLDRAEHQRYLTDIFDTEVSFGKPIFEYRGRRSYNGDGFSFTAYELPDSIRDRFRSAETDPLDDFPIRPSYRKRWDTISWKPSPINPTHKKYIDFGLRASASRNRDQLYQHEAQARSALRRRGNYYALFKYEPSEILQNIDLFVVDLTHSRVYIVNLNL